MPEQIVKGRSASRFIRSSVGRLKIHSAAYHRLPVLSRLFVNRCPGRLQPGYIALAEGDERARGGAETRRPLSPSPGRPPRRGALTGRPVDARARAGAERVDWRRTGGQRR